MSAFVPERMSHLTPVPLCDLGQLLVELRKESGMTQQEFAAVLGTGQARISLNEKEGYPNIGIERAQKIAGIFGVKLMVHVEPMVCTQT